MRTLLPSHQQRARRQRHDRDRHRSPPVHARRDPRVVPRDVVPQDLPGVPGTAPPIVVVLARLAVDALPGLGLRGLALARLGVGLVRLRIELAPLGSEYFGVVRSISIVLWNVHLRGVDGRPTRVGRRRAPPPAGTIVGGDGHGHVEGDGHHRGRERRLVRLGRDGGGSGRQGRAEYRPRVGYFGLLLVCFSQRSVRRHEDHSRW